MEEILKLLITYTTIQYVPAILGTMFIIILVLYKVLKFLFINLKEVYLKIKNTVVGFFDKYNPHLLYKAPFFYIVKGFRTTRIINKTIDPVPDYISYQSCFALTRELLPEALSITNVLYTNGRCCKSIVIPVSYRCSPENSGSLYTTEVKLLALPENFKYELQELPNAMKFRLITTPVSGRYPDVYLENRFNIFREIQNFWLSKGHYPPEVDYAPFDVKDTRDLDNHELIKQVKNSALYFHQNIIDFFMYYTEMYNYHTFSFEVTNQYNSKEVTEDLLSILKVAK